MDFSMDSQPQQGEQQGSENPFSSMGVLGTKRGVEDAGLPLNQLELQRQALIQQQQQLAMQIGGAQAANPVMPLPKRRLTASSMASSANDDQYHAFDLVPHTDQSGLNLYPARSSAAHSTAGSPFAQEGSEQGTNYFSGTIAISQNGNPVDPNTKHMLRHLHMPSYNHSNASSSLNSPSAQSFMTTGTDPNDGFNFEHDSPDMMRDEDTSSEQNQQQQNQDPFSNLSLNGSNYSYASATPEQQQQQQIMMQMQMQQQQQQMQMQQNVHGLEAQPQIHPLQQMANSGNISGHNPVQAAYDSYNGGFLDDEFGDGMSTRYTGSGGDGYAARLEGVMGHA